MIARIGGVAVDVETVVIDRRTGIWCDHCALPSVVEEDWNLVVTATLDSIDRRTVRFCTEDLAGRAAQHPCPRAQVWKRS